MLESNSPPSLIARLSSPSHPLTAAVFALQVVLLWIAVQGTNTVRTSIWKNNYPDACRGRILARFAIWQMLIGSLWVAGMGAYLDGKFTVWLGSRQLSMDLSWLYGAGDASAYRYLFPLTGVACIISLVFFKRMKVRRDWVALNGVVADRSGTESVEPNYAIPGWFATRWGVLRSGLGDALAILKGDRVFRKYMGWMFLSGSSIMMIQVPLLLILKDKFDVSYLQAAGLLTFVPQIALVLSTPLWARWFDAWPLFLFRAVQVGVWVVNRLVLAIAVFQASMPIVVAAAAISGVALAGGRFAWHLGHMEFSDTTNDSSYLGVHQTFTGLRGLLMPFVGAALYRYCFDWHVIWVSGVLLILAAGGYWRMYVRYQAHSGSSSEP